MHCGQIPCTPPMRGVLMSGRLLDILRFSMQGALQYMISLRFPLHGLHRRFLVLCMAMDAPCMSCHSMMRGLSAHLKGNAHAMSRTHRPRRAGTHRPRRAHTHHVAQAHTGHVAQAQGKPESSHGAHRCAHRRCTPTHAHTSTMAHPYSALCLSYKPRMASTAAACSLSTWDSK